MRLAIIIVNYNGSADTVTLLRCLERQRTQVHTVIVVDNDSAEDQRVVLGQYAASSPLPLDVLYGSENRGFAGGCNLGIRKALALGADWTLLLNPDTTVSDTFVDSLLSALPTDPAVVGLPLDEGRRTAYAGCIRWLSASLPHLYRQPGATDACYAIGAAMLVHRDVFADVGFLDERFFLYFEDAEYSVRARSLGYRTVFLDRPVVRHAVSASTRALGSPLLLRYHIRNALLFNRLQGPWWARISLHPWALFGMVRQTVKGILMPRRRASARAIAAGIIDYYGSHFGTLTQLTASDRGHRM